MKALRKSNRRGQVISSTLCALSLVFSASSAYTTGKGIRSTADANRALTNLRNDAPKFFDKMIADAEQNVAAGLITQAQLEILRQRVTKHRELFNSLADEMIAKQEKLATFIAGNSVIRAAATAASAATGTKLYRVNTDLLDKMTWSTGNFINGVLASWNLSEAQQFVEVRDVQESFDRLTQAWAQPEDEFALAMMTARIRPVLQAAGMDGWKELNQQQRDQVRKNATAGIKSLRDKLKAEGWIPPSGEWNHFLRDEISAYLRDSKQTPADRAAKAADKYRSAEATTMNYVGWYEPTWMNEWQAAHPDDEFEIQPLTMSLTIDNRAVITGGDLNYWPGKKGRVKAGKSSYREFSFAPVWRSISVSSEFVSGTVDMRCDRLVDDEGKEVKGRMLDDCSFEARKLANGNWLLEVIPGFTSNPDLKIPLKFVLVPTGGGSPKDAMTRSRYWKNPPDIKQPGDNLKVVTLDEKSLKYECTMTWDSFDLKKGAMYFAGASDDLQTKLELDVSAGTVKGTFGGSFETKHIELWHKNYIKPFLCEGNFAGEITDGRIEKYVNAKGVAHWRFSGKAKVQLELHGGRTIEDRSSTPFTQSYEEGTKQKSIEASIQGSTEVDAIQVSASWYEKRPTMPIVFLLTFKPLPKLPAPEE
jgi:hypothetical protein